MKAFSAGRQAAVTGYCRQTLDEIYPALSDTALDATDRAEKSAWRQTWREIYSKPPLSRFQFHPDYLDWE